MNLFALFLALLIGLLIGGVFSYLLHQNKAQQAESQVHHLENALQEQQTKIQQVEANNLQLFEIKTQVETELKKEKELHQLQLEQYRQQLEAQEARFQQQLEISCNRLKEAAQELTEKNCKTLGNSNLEQVGQLTKPLENTLREMREKLDETQRHTAQQQGSLAEQLKQLLETNQVVGEKAERLTQALKGNNKFQGQWGEMILENLLIAEGLNEGEDYELQYRIKDNRGQDITHDTTQRSLQPDAVLHYPDQQDVIIDAKTSLKDYMDYINASQVDERETALKQHIKSIRTHIKQLSEKNYSAYIQPPRKAIDFVIMFVPNEAALQLALQHDEQLWSEAFDKKILLTGQFNLRLVLRIIRIVWQQHKQIENEHNVFQLAETLISRAGEFIERYEKLGKNISTLQNTYISGQQKLNGRQSIIGLCNQLKDCGVTENPNHTIPKNKDPRLFIVDEEN